MTAAAKGSAAPNSAGPTHTTTASPQPSSISAEGAASELPAPRAHDLVRLQAKIGNAAVRQLLQRQPAPVSGRAASILPALGPWGHVQRDGDPPAADRAADAATVTLDSVTISTAGGAAQFLNERRLKLLEKKSDLERNGQIVDSVGVVLEEAGVQAGNFASKTASDPITQSEADNLSGWWSDFVISYNHASFVIARQAEFKSKEAQEKATAADAEMQRVMAALRDTQRGLFRKEDENKLVATADAIAGVLDCSLSLKDTIEQVTAFVADLRAWTNPPGGASLLPDINTKVPAALAVLESINKAYSALTVARNAVSAIRGGKTEASSATAGLKAAVGAFGAGGTLLGLSATMSLYANLWLGPATEAAVKMIDYIHDMQSKSDNRQAIALGKFEMVVWSLEPGGRPMFDYMLQVMRAEGSEGVPTPVPKMVEKYFLSSQDAMNAGVGAKSSLSEMPTTGWIFKDLDQEKMRRWVWLNRQNIWGMLYGDCPVPSGGPSF